MIEYYTLQRSRGCNDAQIQIFGNSLGGSNIYCGNRFNDVSGNSVDGTVYSK
jgi:hypothetical protein